MAIDSYPELDLIPIACLAGLLPRGIKINFNCDPCWKGKGIPVEICGVAAGVLKIKKHVRNLRF